MMLISSEVKHMLSYQDDPVLYHHGVKGMRWGVRRYRNEDGSLTAKGKKRYLKKYEKAFAKYDKDLGKAEGRLRMAAYNKTADEYNGHKIDEYNKTHDAVVNWANRVLKDNNVNAVVDDLKGRKNG